MQSGARAEVSVEGALGRALEAFPIEGSHLHPCLDRKQDPANQLVVHNPPRKPDHICRL